MAVDIGMGVVHLLIGGIKSIGVTLHGGTQKILILTHRRMVVLVTEIGGGTVIERPLGRVKATGIKVNLCLWMSLIIFKNE